jgi:hypothetical protein
MREQSEMIAIQPAGSAVLDETGAVDSRRPWKRPHVIAGTLDQVELQSASLADGSGGNS